MSKKQSQNNRNDNLKKGNYSKGQSGNPNGRPKKFITTVTKETGYKKSQVTDCMLSMLKMPLLEIKQLADDPKTPSLEVMLARAIHGDCKRGELKNLSEILNRSFGKPKEQVELSGEIDITSELTKDELKKELEKMGLNTNLFDK